MTDRASTHVARRLYVPFFIVGISQGILCSLNWVSLNLLEPYVVCWLHQLTLTHFQAQNRNETELGTTLGDSPAPTSCENAYQDMADNKFEHLLGVWATIRSSFGWAAALGAILASPMADKLGRAKTMYINGIINTVGCLLLILLPYLPLSGTWTPVALILLARFLHGVHTGIGSVVSITYCVEIAPISVRGIFGSAFVVFGNLGVILGNGAGLSFLFGQAHLWNWAYVIPLVLGGFINLFYRCVPESPSFWAHRGNREKLLRCQQRLGHQISPSGCKELEAQHETSQISENEPSASFSWSDIVKSDIGIFRSLVFTFLIFIFSFCNGVVVLISSYTSNVLSNIGVGYEVTQFVTVGLGVLRFVFMIISNQTIERTGRKKPLAGGLALCGFCMLCFIVTSQMEQSGAVLAGNVGLLFLMTAGFDLGIVGPVWCFPSEVMPTKYKCLAQSLGAFTWAVSVASTEFMYPMLLKYIGALAFLYFGFFALAGSVFVHFYVPETKGKSSEELQKEMSELRLFSGSKPVNREITGDDDKKAAERLTMTDRNGDFLIQVDCNPSSNSE